MKLWRTNRLYMDDGTVMVSGIGNDDRYHLDRAEASCLVTDHPAPHPDCECGFWASRERPQRPPDGFVTSVTVYGTVLNNGRHVRAQHVNVNWFEHPGTCVCGQPVQMVTYRGQKVTPTCAGRCLSGDRDETFDRFRCQVDVRQDGKRFVPYDAHRWMQTTEVASRRQVDAAYRTVAQVAPDLAEVARDGLLQRIVAN